MKNGDQGGREPTPPREIQDADNIQQRIEVFGRYHQTMIKQLEDSKKFSRFMYFKRDVDKLERWINEKLPTACESYKHPTNLQAKIQKHHEFETEVDAHAHAVEDLDKTGYEMINYQHFESETIKKRLDEIHRLWDLLLQKSKDKGMKLQQALQLIQFMRECDEEMFWISDKKAFVTSEEFGKDLEHLKVLQKKFDEFQKDLQNHEYRVNQLAKKLIAEGHPDQQMVKQRQEEMNDAWEQLKTLTIKRQKLLFGALEIKRFYCDADDIIMLIAEDDNILSTDDYGRDLASVQALQRKHGRIEIALASLKEKVKQLGGEAERLCETHSDQADDINNKKKEIEKNWEKLKEKAAERKQKLDVSLYLHRFLSHYRDLMSWIGDTKTSISADDFPKVVTGAEALLERNQKHKREIDAIEDSFKSLAEAGQKLMDSDHYVVKEVEEKLVTLANEKTSLLDLWKERRQYYDNCIDFQKLLRDADQADALMTKQAAYLANLCESDREEAPIKNYEDLEKSYAARGEKFKALEVFFNKFNEKHYAADDITTRKEAPSQREDNRDVTNIPNEEENHDDDEDEDEEDDEVENVLESGAEFQSKAEEAFVDQSKAEEAFVDQSEAEEAFVDQSETEEAFVDQSEAEEAFVDQSEAGDANLDQTEADNKGNNAIFITNGNLDESLEENLADSGKYAEDPENPNVQTGNEEDTSDSSESEDENETQNKMKADYQQETENVLQSATDDDNFDQGKETNDHLVQDSSIIAQQQMDVDGFTRDEEVKSCTDDGRIFPVNELSVIEQVNVPDRPAIAEHHKDDQDSSAILEHENVQDSSSIAEQQMDVDGFTRDELSVIGQPLNGWKKIKAKRKTGKLAGKCYTTYVTPLGKRLRSKVEVKSYLKTRKIIIDKHSLQEFFTSKTPADDRARPPPKDSDNRDCRDDRNRPDRDDSMSTRGGDRPWRRKESKQKKRCPLTFCCAGDP